MTAVTANLAEYGMTASMSCKGNCWHNGQTESFFNGWKNALCRASLQRIRHRRVVAGNRMAIIGLGIMGRRMLANALEHPRFEISGLWDPSALSVAKARELMPGAPIGPRCCRGDGRRRCRLPRLPARAAQGPRAGRRWPPDRACSWKSRWGPTRHRAGTSWRLKTGRLGAVVNFTQASSRGFEELRRAIDAGETGELTGIDIVVTYPAWPRAWQKEAEWLRLRAEGGYTRAR
jgi:hypothetical protein